MVARITSPGIDEEFRLERAHQHDRPFDEARDFVEQRLVLDQFKALRKGELLGIGQDRVLAPLRIEHDLGVEQLRLVILEAAHIDRAPAP